MLCLKATLWVLTLGLASAALFIPTMVVLGGEFRWVGIVLIGPAEFLKDRVLHTEAFTQGAHHMWTAAFVVGVWWAVFSAAWALARKVFRQVKGT